MDGILITRDRLHQVLTMAHVALIEHDPGRAGAYLQVLRDLTAAEGAPIRGAAVTEAFHAPSLAAEEAQPAHHHTMTDGPGRAAATSAPLRRGGRPPRVWTAERDALMRERFPTSEDDEALLRDLNAIPAPQPVPSARQVQRRAWELGLKRAEHLRFAAHKRAGSAAMAARRERGDFAPSKWTAEREALLRADLPDCVDTRALLARINALPGEPVASVDSMRQRAKALGIRRSVEAARFAQGAARQGMRKPLEKPARDPTPDATAAAPDAQPPPRPHAQTAAAWAGSPRKGALLPARADDEKADAFEAFASGQSVRQVAEDFGAALSVIATWHAEWKARQAKREAAE